MHAQAGLGHDVPQILRRESRRHEPLGRVHDNHLRQAGGEAVGSVQRHGHHLVYRDDAVLLGPCHQVEVRERGCEVREGSCPQAVPRPRGALGDDGQGGGLGQERPQALACDVGHRGTHGEARHDHVAHPRGGRGLAAHLPRAALREVHAQLQQATMDLGAWAQELSPGGLGHGGEAGDMGARAHGSCLQAREHNTQRARRGTQDACHVDAEGGALEGEDVEGGGGMPHAEAVVR